MDVEGEKMARLRLIHLGIISILILFFIFSGTFAFIGFSQPQNATWFNTTWHYRIRLEINSSGVARSNWTIEYPINFTDLIPAGSFDINSIRVIEYNSTGSILNEIPSQFDTGENYNGSTNAAGTLIFIMNSTTLANKTRVYFVYYDSIENGIKPQKTYSTNITYTV